jgi:hypothetical protein
MLQAVGPRGSIIQRWPQVTPLKFVRVSSKSGAPSGRDVGFSRVPPVVICESGSEIMLREMPIQGIVGFRKTKERFRDPHVPFESREGCNQSQIGYLLVTVF